MPRCLYYYVSPVAAVRSLLAVLNCVFGSYFSRLTTKLFQTIFSLSGKSLKRNCFAFLWHFSHIFLSTIFQLEENTHSIASTLWFAYFFLIDFSFLFLFGFSWDETHFGKMGSWYINRTFFFDVHPPLGKVWKRLILTGKCIFDWSPRIFIWME